MAIQDGVFLNRLNVDRVCETMAQIESERLGVRVRYVGKRLKEGETKNEAGQEIREHSVKVVKKDAKQEEMMQDLVQVYLPQEIT